VTLLNVLFPHYVREFFLLIGLYCQHNTIFSFRLRENTHTNSSYLSTIRPARAGRRSRNKNLNLTVYILNLYLIHHILSLNHHLPAAFFCDVIQLLIRVERDRMVNEA